MNWSLSSEMIIDYEDQFHSHFVELFISLTNQVQKTNSYSQQSLILSRPA